MTATEIPDVPDVRGADVWLLADEEYRRWIDAVAALGVEHWDGSTDCDRWNVRDLCLHILGSMEAQASPGELVRQFRKGLPLNKSIGAAHWVDGVNEQQLRDRRHLSDAEIVEKTAAIASRAVKGRRSTPPPIRWLPIPFGPPIGWKRLTYLLLMGFTRDAWMHRVDLARAVGTDMVITPEHDGRIVAGILVEWATRHGEPFEMSLSGPAGGTYRQGSGGESLELDAVEFCRILSGRATGQGLLARHNLPL